MIYAVGIDVGGTKIVGGVVDGEGNILARSVTQAHAEEQPAVVMDAIVEVYEALLAQSNVEWDKLVGLGLGFPGNTNGPAGIVLASSNLPDWDNYPLRDALSQRLGLPVVLDNDANVCAVGEYRFGAGQGVKHMCYVTFSTGYGIGIIINGQAYVGQIGTAGELGHVVIDIDGPLCSCGKRGCIMAYASGIGISRMAYERLGDAPLLRELVSDIEAEKRIPAERVVEAAQQGDQVAQEILEIAGYYGGVGLSMIVQILNPELIVVGGGLVNAGPLLLEPMMSALYEHTQPESWDSIRVDYWQLGDDIGILGAAAQVFETMSSHNTE